MEREFTAVRCAACKRVLYEIEKDALKPTRAVKKICERCGAVNVQLGKHPPVTAAP